MLRIIIALVFVTSAVGAFAQAKESSCAKFKQALHDAQALRGLKLLHPVQCKQLSEQEFHKVMRTHFLADTSLERLGIEEIVYKLIGVVPENYPYRDCIVEASSSDVLAFYQPELKLVAVPNWTDTPYEILVHEAVHVLQDQHFNLAKLRKTSMSSGDAYLALAALVEGDATYIQNRLRRDLKLENLHKPKPPVRQACALPEILEQSTNFAYDYGLIFVDAVRKKGGEAALNHYFSAPPKTTRDVLYVRRLLDGILPSGNEMLGDKQDRHLMYSEQLGEFLLRAILKAGIGPQDGVLAAKGWLGDRIQLLRQQAGIKLEWVLRWENNRDASEFYRGFIRTQAKRYSLDLSPQESETRFKARLEREIVVRLCVASQDKSCQAPEVRIEISAVEQALPH